MLIKLHHFLDLQFPILKEVFGDAWVAQWFSATFSPGCDPGDQGSSPMSGSLHRACVSASLSLSLCLMNK